VSDLSVSVFLWRKSTIKGFANEDETPRIDVTTEHEGEVRFYFMSGGKIELLINELTKMQEILNGRSEILRNKEGNTRTPGDVQERSSELNI